MQSNCRTSPEIRQIPLSQGNYCAFTLTDAEPYGCWLYLHFYNLGYSPLANRMLCLLLRILEGRYIGRVRHLATATRGRPAA